MEDTQVGQDLIEIGVEKGFEEGMEKGMQKGLVKGISEGIHKGKHQLIIRILLHKFGTIPEDMVNRIQTIDDDDKLEEIALKTVDLISLEQLRQLLN